MQRFAFIRLSAAVSAFVAAALSLAFAAPALADTHEVVIAYQDMVVPWRYAQASGALEKATGYKITFRKLDSGADVIRALASGSVQLGEAGSSPIAAGLSQGVDISLFWILDNINDAEALVARNGTGIHSVADLKGKKIGVPYVSTSHFHTLVALQNAGVNPADVQILNLRPAGSGGGLVARQYRRDLYLGPRARQGQAKRASTDYVGRSGETHGQSDVRRFRRQPKICRCQSAIRDPVRQGSSRSGRRLSRAARCVAGGIAAGRRRGQRVRRQSAGRAGKSRALCVSDARAASVGCVVGRRRAIRGGQVAVGDGGVLENTGHDSKRTARLFGGRRSSIRPACAGALNTAELQPLSNAGIIHE